MARLLSGSLDALNVGDVQIDEVQLSISVLALELLKASGGCRVSRCCDYYIALSFELFYAR